MFERLQKPFLTVETGEAYQPIRLSYTVVDLQKLIHELNNLHCLEKNPNAKDTWSWLWKDECNDQHFESIDSYVRNQKFPVRLGTLSIRDNRFYFHLPSFKRACLAVAMLHRYVHPDAALIDHADFINKVFGLDEKLPHGLTELFDENELEKIVTKRITDYDDIQTQCEQAATPEEAFAILSSYSQTEAKKRLPYAERYTFTHTPETVDPDVLYLGFYIFLRSRELVAIRRWFGNPDYSLQDAAEETVEQVFGGMDLDIIE